MWTRTKAALVALLRRRYQDWKRQGDGYVAHWRERWSDPRRIR